MTRPEARVQALEVLYEAEQRDGTIAAAHVTARAQRVIEGVLEHEEAIDAVVGRLSKRWSIDRMPVIDRVLLRLGAWELLHTDTPTAVVISEVVGLAGIYSTQRSGHFINGVLGALAEEARPEGDEPVT
ncbi:MAG: transcription antitermination factor NusB [Acidimicrobiia bacterium]|nr:MAG: transcription antitermination factor NusB [Acidimicrobiia bacterium]